MGVNEKGANARMVLLQARFFVKAALDCSGYDVSKDEEWAEFIEEYGNMGAYLMSADSVLREACGG